MLLADFAAFESMPGRPAGMPFPMPSKQCHPLGKSVMHSARRSVVFGWTRAQRGKIRRCPDRVSTALVNDMNPSSDVVTAAIVPLMVAQRDQRADLDAIAAHTDFRSLSAPPTRSKTSLRLSVPMPRSLIRKNNKAAILLAPPL
ncbi:hypothetical protein [Xanthomonas sp. WHRI 7945]|nr:hypothetical protein [Xanthomonas campestris pv. campestris]